MTELEREEIADLRLIVRELVAGHPCVAAALQARLAGYGMPAVRPEERDVADRIHQRQQSAAAQLERMLRVFGPSRTTRTTNGRGTEAPDRCRDVRDGTSRTHLERCT